MKNKENVFRVTFFFIGLSVVLGIVVLIYTFRPGKERSTISIGAVYIGDANDNGWNEFHYEGLKKACQKYDCEGYSQFRVPEDEQALTEAVDFLVDRGCSCICLTSSGYGAYLDNLARKFPKVAFFSISGDGTRNNCMTYFARMYQARYLTGIAAGAATSTNTLAYVASMPIEETIRSINAYTMGARRANPKVKVLVKYTWSWEDKEKEEAAMKELAAAGADVVTYHEDRSYAIDLADEMGLYTTGYNYVHKDYSDRFLTAALTNWDIIYEQLLGDYLSGRANFSEDYWLGLSEGAVSIYPLSDQVTEKTKARVAAEEKRICSWRDVFSGVIYDNNGQLRCERDERISDKELFEHMDWYVEGVNIYE